MQSRYAIGRWLLAGVFAALTQQVFAQTLDDVTVTVQGNDVVAHVSFSGSVRLVQQSPATPTQFVQFQVELLTADETSLKQRTAESRRVPATATSPEFTLVLNAAPNVRTRQMTMQISELTQVRARQGANPRTIDILLVGKARTQPVAQVSEQRYAVKLASGPSSAMDRVPAVPARFQNYEVFDTRSVVDGVSSFELNLGYFSSEADAETARKSLLERFPKAVVVDLSRRRAETLKSASVQLDKKPAVATAAPSQPVQPLASPADKKIAEKLEETARDIPPMSAASAEIEAKATELLAAAKEAVSKENTETAISKLNQLLLLPPNSATQDAQEMIGIAWERAGNLARARVEYELYLKLFEGGDGAQRVARRLASMNAGSIKPGAPSEVARTEQAKKPEVKYNGNIAQYYFGGKSRSQSLVNLAAGIDQSTLSKTTESALVTNVDLGARYTTEASDIRAVLRGTGSANLTATSHNTSVLNAAYVDYRQKASGLAVRFGRQSPINGGLLGIFDGVSLTYPVRPSLRLSLMGGVPANPLVTAPAETLFAGMIEADAITENLSGDIYIIEQRTQTIANRRAIGAEARYSNERGSMYALLDYDQLFRAVNAVSLQGSLQGGGQTTYTILLDSRKAPSLQMTNALISSGAASLRTLLQMQSLEEIRTAALGTTAKARQALFSVSRPISAKWQLTGDLRASDIGALPAVGNFDATPATGAQTGLSMQLTGSNLYSKRDINNFNLSYLSTPLFRGVQLSYNNLTGFNDNKITLEPSLRWYTQRDDEGSKLTRISPGLRGTYNFSKRTSVLGEGLLERSTNQGTTNNATINSGFFYFGVRYELF
ncbi:MAG: hypothetical protein IPP88_11315 [Betaproteobacteria bacterium]|nr:hypothetical protein [Betaproteobacteria bacterium]